MSTTDDKDPVGTFEIPTDDPTKAATRITACCLSGVVYSRAEDMERCRCCGRPIKRVR